MKNNRTYLTGILALASLIVAPALSSVNHSQDSNVAEGSPLPVPHKLLTTVDTVVIAEGSPLPVPHKLLTTVDTVVIAEGSPLPVPHKTAAIADSVLIA
ncbi:MAG: hypothetical protein M3P45_16400 [Acidobacteriota bacterium]|nr:hypothetical protein [Acidobacteriota bacterium]